MQNGCKAEALRASVVIPCHSVHALFLQEVLGNLERQTVLPWEVVIALSDLNHVSPCVLNKLESSCWPFPVTLITSQKLLYAGQNRNLACSYAQGDIIICQDADDVPHPQRIEIVRYFFENSDADLLVHTFMRADEKREIIFKMYNDFEEIKRLNPESYDNVVKNAIANGSIAARSNILKKYTWPSSPRGQDVTFNRMLFNVTPNRLIVYAPLYAYRQYFSSLSIDSQVIQPEFEYELSVSSGQRNGYPVKRIINV
jgi:glycosyltransferase involved in cell wall biosynthesis